MENKLKINSCSQKWEDMMPTACGRFCNACQKEVIDFRQMELEAMIAVHSSAKEKVCGVYNSNQVEVIKRFSIKRPSMQAWKAWYLGVLGIFFAETAAGQEINDTTQVRQMQTTKDGIRIDDGVYSYHGGLIQEIKDFNVKGKVVFKGKQEPVIFANVIVRETNSVVSTDFDGYFQLNLEKAFQRSEKVKIEFSYLGLETKEVVLTKSDTVFSRQIDWIIEMEEKEIVLDGIVIVGGVGSLVPELPAEPKKEIWYGIKRFFRFEWLKKD